MFFNVLFRLPTEKTNCCNFNGLVNRDLNLNIPLQLSNDIEDAIEYLNTAIQIAA